MIKQQIYCSNLLKICTNNPIVATPVAVSPHRINKLIFLIKDNTSFYTIAGNLSHMNLK